MKESQVEEIRQIIEQAGQGNYMPLLIIAGVIVFCFSLVSIVLLAWYKKDQNSTQKWLEELSKNSTENHEIMTKFEAWREYHQKDYDEFKKEMKQSA